MPVPDGTTGLPGPVAAAQDPSRQPDAGARPDLRPEAPPESLVPPAPQPVQEAAPRTPPAFRAANPAAIAWPARQLAPFAVALALGADSSLTLTLDPVELGRVEVAIERQGAESAIRVTAERPETLALLQRDARELERALADAGLGQRGPSLSFGLSAGGPGQGSQDQGGGSFAQQQQGQAGGQARQPGRDLAAPLASLARRSLPHAGVLDLAV
ncbi:hypothetical protein HEQ75_22905 [Roseomonas sp. BU-1]|uniref:Flagellar hook-length control protein-like C-terminal domain-containing protein n=2 Tax=Falsiroseomonas selenitidurans TaxID=2716335 RepID=A0ABX1E9M5_9PROT|nr:hypothetical protein [Falsiroseomonas selenitidurans]